jgi:hypothetical protein
MSKENKHPNDILNEYVSEKVLKAIPEYVKEEMDTMGEEELRQVIVQAHGAMKQVEEELAANEKYQQAKQAVSDLSQGKRETNKYQKAKIAYSLGRLEQIGKLDLNQKYDLALALREARAKLEQKRAKSKDIVEVAETGKVTVTHAPEGSESDDTSSEEENS